jgi:DNA topoisomerase-1
VSLLAEKKAGGARRGRATPASLRTLGEHPGEGGPITVRDGRYGPYVNHGKINATLPKGMDPATITLDQAVGLIAARAEKGPGKPKRRSTGTTAKAPKVKRAKADAEADQD